MDSHKENRLSYLMGAKSILDNQLNAINIIINKTKESGSRELFIPNEAVSEYIELIKKSLDNGFWNEVIGPSDIHFVFKFKDGSIKEIKLDLYNEAEIAQLCHEFNNDPLEKTSNVYRYLSENNFYHDFMLEHYSQLVNRA